MAIGMSDECCMGQLNTRYRLHYVVKLGDYDCIKDRNSNVYRIQYRSIRLLILAVDWECKNVKI